MPNLAQREVEATISAQNTFTDGLFLEGRKLQRFTVVVEAGTFVLTPTIQISEDNSTWTDIDLNNFGAITNVGGERSGEIFGEWYVRVGVKTGEYTSGSATMFIKRGF